MDFVLLTVGSTHIKFVNDGIGEYKSRLRRYIPFSLIELPDAKTGKTMSKELHKEKEGKLIISKLSASDRVVLLDERGTEFTSTGFASYIEKTMASGSKRLVFVVGGPYGFSDEVYSRANEKISLSRMTFNHEMVRIFFIEQLYRAMTIIRGEPYHHE
ncbi:MAG: 23S rRNA (pseudouridine(1915)-N(3))-methyltransferase RlmH [Candidatus Amulumruptor caecigallinarius]|nr:23S rRNA (pseudouridine(1915)-N(3))-methyltransferase RlmH [Candidatus Amulumruptor caecigallinarius]